MSADFYTEEKMVSRVEHVDRVDGSRKERKERKDMAGVKILLVTSAWHMKRARLMFVALHEWVGIVGYTIFR